MKLFSNLVKEKQHNLWGEWYITLKGKYERIEAKNYVQLANKDVSRIIYGSSFIIAGIDSMEDNLEYLETKKDETGSTSMSASVTQNNEILTIVVTYMNPADEQWARDVIESAKKAL